MNLWRARTRRSICLFVATVAVLTSSSMPSPAVVDNSPRFLFESQADTVDTPSTLRLTIQQNDYERPFFDYGIRIAPTWRFGGSSIRDSAFGSCKEFADTVPEEDPDSFDSERPDLPLDQMEAVGYARLIVATRDTRPSAAIYNGGPVAPGHAGETAAIWFLRWDNVSDTAILCARVRTTNSTLTSSSVERSTIVFQIDLHRNTDDSWDMSFDFSAVPGEVPGTRSITDDEAYFMRSDVAIREIGLTLAGRTGGNYNPDPVTGEQCIVQDDNKTGTNSPGHNYCSTSCEPCRAVMSMTPTDPALVDVTALMTPCPLTNSCEPIVRHVRIPVRLPPTTYPLEAGKLTAPSNLAPPTAQTVGLGLVRGTNEVRFQWTPPVVGSGERVRGYVLTIARRGVQESRHFEYIVTDSTAGDFDARHACGSDGLAETCSLTLLFPLSTVGNEPLDTDGIYDASLVTIYANGHRTDKRCDDGTPEGMECPASVPKINVAASGGISALRFVLRDKEWPLAYFNGSDNLMLLLLDFRLRQGEMIVLGSRPYIQHEGPYFSASNGITGDNEQGGAVSFGSAHMTGHAVAWRFDGVATSGSATGSFTLYDPRGQPSRLVSGGGTGISGPNDNVLWIRTFNGSVR